MQTIATKYLGATDHRGARIKATHTGAYTSVTLGYDDALSAEGNHIAAAAALAGKLEWEGDYTGGHTATGMVFVNPSLAYSFSAQRKEVAA